MRDDGGLAAIPYGAEYEYWAVVGLPLGRGDCRPLMVDQSGRHFEEGVFGFAREE